MQILKIFGLGTLFLFPAFFMYGMLGGVRFQEHSAHATGVTAILGDLEDGTVYSPIFWLIVLAAYGAAFWVVKRKRYA